MHSFLVSPRKKPSWRRLNTLGQKQYLVGEVRENCLVQVNEQINQNRVSAIRVPPKLMDVISSMSKNQDEMKSQGAI